MNYVYHGSSIPNLEVIKKHKSTHMKEWVYACHSKVITTIFLSKQGSDLFYSLSGDGKNYPVELVERKPGMFKKIFNCSGYIYKLDASNFKENQRQKENLVIENLQMVGLNETYLKRNPFTLSSGEKRKVAIASILIHDPEVIILDEPTIGLDNASKKNIIKTIKSLKTKYNKTVFVISKDTDLLLKICDYVVVLNKGQVVLEGNKYDVFTNKNLEDYGVKRPDIINFEMLALNKKKVKLGYRDEINDLMKDVYRYVK